MRTFSSNVQAVLDSDDIRVVYLITLEFDTTYRFTSYNSNIFYGGRTYLSDGGLFEFDTPKFTSVIDREAYKVVITDLIDEMAAEFKLNVVGKPVSVKIALLDSDGYPMLGTDDVLSIYNGFVDAPRITNDFEQKLAVIDCTSPMSDLDTVNAFFTSKDGMDQVSQSDTSFDEIFDNKEISLKWGKV
jgi:hypothetical protein